jgi:RNA polymerase sigma-70 factor (ECF subfamily)
LVAKPATARIEPTVTLSLEQHVEAVYRYALRLTRRPDLAEDVTQEAMLRGWRNRRKLREPGAARLWLLRIATNVWTDYLRKSNAQPHELAVDPLCPRPAPTQAYDERECVRLALAAMDQLPPRQRQVLYLITCEQLSQEDVADVLGVRTATVKANLSLARKEMRRRLKDIYESVCPRAACKTTHHDQ